MLTLDKFEEASEKVKEVTLETKLIYSDFLSNHTGNKVYFKPENMQYTGAYKVRGAYYKISTLTDEERAKGLITASAGNHAQGVAYAAKCYGCKAVIVMPTTTPLIKVNRTKSYGAEVILHGDVYDDAYAYACELAEKEHLYYVHPTSDRYTVGGQGTISLEILDQCPQVEQIVVPIGGGGLITGIALTMKTLKPSVKIYGVMPVGSAVYVESRRQGQLVTLDHCSSMADAVVRKTGEEYLYPYIEKYVDDIFTVTEDSIRQAVRTACLYGKLTLEGSGALALAALLEKKCPLSPGTVLICSGGNIDKAVLDLCMQA